MGKKLQNGPQGGWGRTPTLAPKVCNRCEGGGGGGGAIGECW